MEKTKKELVHEAYRKFLAADEAWHINLVKAYGKDAGDKRYLPESSNIEGYAEFKAAGDEWRRLM